MKITLSKVRSLITLCTLVVIMLVLMGRHNYDKNSPSGHLKLKLSQDDTWEYILSVSDNTYLEYELKKDIPYEITLEQDNQTFKDTYISLVCDKGNIKVEEMDIEGSNITLSFTKQSTFFLQADEDTRVSATVFTYNKKLSKQILYTGELYYLNHLIDFTDTKKDLAIVLTGDILSYKEDLIIRRPCEIYINGYDIELAGNIIVEYESDKPFVLHVKNKKQVKVDGFYTNTPNSDISIDQIFFEDKPEYGIRAKTFNGNTLSNEISIESPKKFFQLVDDNFYPILYPGTTIYIDDITLDKVAIISFYGYHRTDIVTTSPFNLNVKKEFNIQDVNINLQTDHKGTIKINISKNAKMDYENLIIDAPFCDLVWINDPPKEEYVTKYMNVKAYQGNAMESLGGIGKGRIIEFNSKDDHNLSWYVKGNAIETTIPFSVMDQDLSNIEIDFKVNEGTAEIAESFLKEGNKVNLNESPLITVIDEKGDRRTYTISVVRKKHSLPVIYIETENKQPITSKEEYIQGTFQMDADHINKNYSVERESMRIRGRGNSTWKLFNKKAYRIKFDEKVSILGLKPNRDWVLLANYSDQSLIRNYVATEMGKKLSNLKFTPSSYPVDVFVNGEYMGVYSIGEQIEVAKSRVNIDEDYNDPDTGYLLEVGGTDNVLELGIDFFHATNLKWIAIKSPDTRQMTKEHFKFISEYTKKTDHAIINHLDYENYIDVYSLIDWVILHEFTCNLDSGFRRSCFLYKEKGGKLHMGPIWDFDLAFGNYFRDSSYDKWFTCGGETLGYTWTTYLYDNPSFTKLYKKRWNEVKKTLKETALNTIENGKEMVYDSQKYNFQKWDQILGQKTSLQPDHMKDLKTFEEHIDYLTEFINSRYEWLDAAINNLP